MDQIHQEYIQLLYSPSWASQEAYSYGGYMNVFGNDTDHLYTCI